MQVFPTAPSPTVTHLINLAVLILLLLLLNLGSNTIVAKKQLKQYLWWKL